jgi:uncharacterized hydrophobic protein (TIGR00271 family)
LNPEDLEVTSKTPGTLVVLLGPDLKVALQMRWAVRLASARKLDLLILHRVESPDERVVEVSLDEAPSGVATGVINEVKHVIEECPALQAVPRGSDEAGEGIKATASGSIHVRMKLIYFASLASLRRAVLDELGNRDVVLFTQAREQIADMSDVDLVRERRLFLRYIPCEVVLCHGLDKQNALSRILVATAPGPNGRAALQIGQELVGAANGTLTALHVNPGVGIDAQQVGERRLERLLSESPGTGHPVVSRRVVVDDHIQQGIHRVWEEGNHDVVVVGLSGSWIAGSLGAKLGKHATVIFVSSASTLANRFREFLDESFQRFVPQIEREDRIALVDRLQSSAAWNFDFLALMVLSTTMAAIGLIQNSAAVVIGAMLVAPLMTPLLGLGLALVQGNRVLAMLSIRSVMFGLCVSLLGGFLVGFTALGFEEPTREMFSRGGPGLLDLSVAFAAGLAAAYASSRPSLIAALPGVAIAAALVPPIATSGLALSLGDFPLAIGALLLFIINMVTIVLASMASLWAVGFRNLKQYTGWTRMAGSAVIASVLALGVYLSLQSGEYELTEELPEGLVAAVQKNVGKDYRFEDLAVAYDELGVQLYVQVVGKAPASAEMATGFRTLISDYYKQPVRVRLLTRIAVDTATNGP